MRDAARRPAAGTLAALADCQRPILRLYERWLADGRLDMGAFEAAHDAATVAAHRHYVARIPAYRALADGLDLIDTEDPDEVRAELTSTDDLFKSYDTAWLDSGDFGAMTGWVRGISTAGVELDEPVGSIEAWLRALARRGTHIRYSSASSGRLSLVPRDRTAWRTHGELAPVQVQAATARYGVDLAGADAYLLCFRGEHQAFAALGEQLAAASRTATFLFDFEADADHLRALIRGTPGGDGFRRFRAATVDGLAGQYDRILSGLARSARDRRPAFVYGAPYQVHELCTILADRGERIALPPGSGMWLAGGWKTFEGSRIPREALVDVAAERLGVDPALAMEGYGMTECTFRANRCAHGRFHIPPAVRPMVVDDALYPIEGGGLGRYAFTDPFATAFPGFFITGDEVELTLDRCDCGQAGYSMVGEIRRATGHEIKGCGGVMGAIRA